jgi:hypothetical protein
MHRYAAEQQNAAGCVKDVACRFCVLRFFVFGVELIFSIPEWT